MSWQPYRTLVNRTPPGTLIVYEGSSLPLRIWQSFCVAGEARYTAASVEEHTTMMVLQRRKSIYPDTDELFVLISGTCEIGWIWNENVRVVR